MRAGRASVDPLLGAPRHAAEAGALAGLHLAQLLVLDDRGRGPPPRDRLAFGGAIAVRCSRGRRRRGSDGRGLTGRLVDDVAPGLALCHGDAAACRSLCFIVLAEPVEHDVLPAEWFVPNFP